MPRAIVPMVALMAALVLVGGALAVGATGTQAGRTSRQGSTPVRHPGGRSTPAATRTATGTREAGRPLDPSLFATGSCMAFAPTAGDRHRTVFLDAGHGGIDPGAVGVTEAGQAIQEGDQTLPVELDAMSLLRAQGYRVVVSRTTSATVARMTLADLTPQGILTAQAGHDDVAARDVCANLARADVLVGLYFDAGGSPSDAGSITAYDAARPFAAHNLRLATLVQADVLAQLSAHGWSVPDDGVQSDVSLGGPPLTYGGATYGHLLLLGPALAGYFNTPSQMPGALIEPLFITDPYEGTIAASPAGQQAIARGVAQAVEQYLRVGRSLAGPAGGAVAGPGRGQPAAAGPADQPERVAEATTVPVSAPDRST